LTEQQVEAMYNMGSPPYLARIVQAGAEATKTEKEASGYLRRYILAMGLTDSEVECLEDKYATKGVNSMNFELRREPRMPAPIDHTNDEECEQEMDRISSVMFRKRVLADLQAKVEHLEKRRLREPDHQELTRKAIVELAGKTAKSEAIDIFGDITRDHEKQFMLDFPARNSSPN
jgi:hypothetical protein